MAYRVKHSACVACCSDDGVSAVPLQGPRPNRTSSVERRGAFHFQCCGIVALRVLLRRAVGRATRSL
eukprot:15447457-Alexandrium_andersonii.AAC.2